MKSYLDLIPISAKIHRRQSRMTRVCIFLAVFLVTVIFSMADMEIRSQKIQAIQSDGRWHAGFGNLTDEQAALIASRPEVEVSSWYNVLNYSLDQDYRIEETETVICGFDEELLEMFPASAIVEGEYPREKNEAAVTRSVKERLLVEIGDTICLTMPEGEELSLTITGFTGNTSLVTSRDAFGLFLNRETFRRIDPSQEDEFEDSMLYLRFVPHCNIPDRIEEIREQFGLEERQIAQNTKYLALILQSRNSYMMKLYFTAAVLAVLVVVAGTLMITGSLNSNIAQRTEFFGMMRCLGATEKQVMRFVRREALSWCRSAIPMGVAAGMVVTWGLCALLKALSPGLFDEMPVMGLSWVAVLAGIIVGLFSVFLSARSPAKKAARVSPLTAVSGNGGTVWPVKRAVNIPMVRVDTALGIHHAWGSRKNYFLLTGSFAFAIILFLAFSSGVDFMKHGITPLKPYTPDLSIISAGEACSLPMELGELLMEKDGVKRVFGRSIARDVSVKSEGRTQHIQLVSYEKFQFEWAKEMLLEGSIEETEQGAEALVVYQGDFPIKPGSTLIFPAEGGERSVKVSGILSDSPLGRIQGKGIVICSEELFRELTGQEGYAVVDIQLSRDAVDEAVAALRQAAEDCISDSKKIALSDFSFSDKRMKNDEARGAYYSLALFIYGFLAVIALISACNVINGIAMSVSARRTQYDAMKAIGMEQRQMTKMVAAEAAAYTLSGIFAGCGLGLPINRILFLNLVTSRWGDSWRVPGRALTVILLVVTGAAILAVWNSTRRRK